MTDKSKEYFERNRPYIRADASDFATILDPHTETAFRNWVKTHSVPFDLNQMGPNDYDMRGFYQALSLGDPLARSAIDPNDQRMHYPDFWKTPYHQTFSAESQWATPDAPQWNDRDQLVDKSGSVIFDDRAKNVPTPPEVQELMGQKSSLHRILGQIPKASKVAP